MCDADRFDSRTAISVFHWIASFFYLHIQKALTPVDQIKNLREKGYSIAKIASMVGSTASVVRRIVGKVDPAEVEKSRLSKLKLAKEIDELPISWREKTDFWTKQTGHCSVTFWRLVKANRQKDSELE